MSKVSKYFWRSEITCKCGCGFDTIDAELMRVADEVREYVGGPIAPNSACRCEWWNGKEGGGQFSQHRLGKAIDLPVADVEDVYNWLDKKYPDRYGIGKYKRKGFVHLDVRGGPPARWDG